MLQNKTTEELIEIFKAKAPVCICVNRPCTDSSSRYCGPQRITTKVANILYRRGVSFSSELIISREHAMADKGREEFDYHATNGGIKVK